MNGGTGGTKYGAASAGAGNPADGTGGLLVIWCNELENLGIISSEGSSASVATTPGGSSGGGSINLFYNVIKAGKDSKISVEGGKQAISTAIGEKGGSGSINKGKVVDGTFIEERLDIDKVDVLVKMIDKNCNYTTIEELINDTEMLNKIFNNVDSMKYVLASKKVILPKVVSNENIFTMIANNEQAFTLFCNNEDARLAMYNEYAITEKVIANSTIALNVMTKSDRYLVIHGDAKPNRYMMSLYPGKAFVLGISQSCANEGSAGGTSWYCYHGGNYLSRPGVSSNHIGGAASYGTTGLKVRVNLFASSVVGAIWNHMQGGSWLSKGGLHVAIFMI